jgi:hypothetical protein
MELNSSSKKKSLGKFVGVWHITEMEMWDAKYFNMERQAYLEINSQGLGDFQFGLVTGQIDGEVEMAGNIERFSFTWGGSDELDPGSGSGWISLHSTDKIIGKIKIHLGDSSEFKGVKAK